MGPALPSPRDPRIRAGVSVATTVVLAGAAALAFVLIVEDYLRVDHRLVAAILSVEVLGMLAYIGLHDGNARRDPLMYLSIAGPSTSVALVAIAVALVAGMPALAARLDAVAGLWMLLFLYGPKRFWYGWRHHVLRGRTTPENRFGDELLAELNAARDAIAAVAIGAYAGAPVRKAEDAIADVRTIDAPDAQRAAIRDAFADRLAEWLALKRRRAEPAEYEPMAAAWTETMDRWWVVATGHGQPR